MERAREGSGESKQCGSRVDALIRFLRQNAERIDSTTKLKIEFNCAGRLVTPRITFVEEARPFKF